MSQIINAVYEDGVLKPLQALDVKEHEKIAIKVVSLNDWQNRFNQLMEKLHKKSAKYSSEEIESDVSQAIQESREAKRGR